MKKFRDFISEEVVPTALIQNGSIDLDKEEVRASINLALAKVTADGVITPYIALNRISKALAYFHIILPKKVYLEGGKGVEVHELRQFGHKMGMTDQGEFVHEVPGKYFLFIQYGMNAPVVHGGQYAWPTIGGTFRVMAKVVDQTELDRLMSMAELALAEDCMDAEHQQRAAKMLAPHETMRDVTADEKKKGNKQAVATSQKGLSEDENVHAKGAKVHVPFKGKMTQGTVVRHDKGDRHGSPFYVVDVGDYRSEKVPAHKVRSVNEEMSHDARELATYADNHAQLHRSSHQPIIKNLSRKHAKGTYDHGKAEKLWGYHAKRAADAYHKEYGHKFSVAHRREAAKHMADSARDEHGFGSVKEDHLDEGMKIVSKGYGNVHVVQGGKTVKKFTDPRDAHIYVSQQGKKKAVKEEQIDELSKETLKKYVNKSHDSLSNARYDAHHASISWKPGAAGKYHDALTTIKKRETGIDKALGKLSNKAKVSANEEVEQIDELNKSTLVSYIRKASHDVGTQSAATGRYADRANKSLAKYKKGGDYSDWQEHEKNSKVADKAFKKSWKRREGITKAADRLMKENQLDEVSKETLVSYIPKAAHSLGLMSAKRAGKVSKDIDYHGSSDYEKALTKHSKRLMGITKATHKLAKEEAINERLTKKMSAGDVISDFVHSDDPRFEGKSKKVRMRMALGAYYDKHPELSKKKVDEQRLDELHGKDKLGDITKANYKKMQAHHLGHGHPENPHGHAVHRGNELARMVKDDEWYAKHGGRGFKRGIKGFSQSQLHRAAKKEFTAKHGTNEELKFDPSTEIPKNS